LRIWKTIVDQWFLIALGFVVLVGTIQSDQLAWLGQQAWLRSSIVFVVMVLMALPVPLSWVRRALSEPWPAILASLINMGLFPVLAYLFACVIEPYLGGGLIVAAAIPCTLASAAVWTSRAGGDDTVAVLVTLITNVTCVIVTPLWLVFLLGKRVSMDLADLIQGLLILVLLPMTLAQLARIHVPIAQWATKKKKSIAYSCQFGILTMVLFGAIQMGQRMRTTGGDSSLTLWQVASVVILASTLHLLVLATGWWLAERTGVERPQKIAVAMKLAIDCGFSILPMIVYHISQLVLDTILADRWRKYAPQTPPETPLPSAVASRTV
jgi:sodium/bile acid cotransporter 7